MSSAKFSSGAKILSLPGNFRFYGILGCAGLFSILWNFWKSTNETVPYDTYIIFKKHLGAMLFAQNISLKKIFSEV